MTGREIFKRNKQLMSLLVWFFKIIPGFIRFFLWDATSRYSQILFIGIRYIILKSLVAECGDNIRIGTNVRILNWDNIRLGNNVSIHDNCYLDATGGIEIGNEVSIAHNSSILSTNHDWNDHLIAIKYNAIIPAKVIVNDDVWIACGCRILAGVTIGTRSIIAAGAVVTKTVENNSIYGGVPAKLIKKI